MGRKISSLVRSGDGEEKEEKAAASGQCVLSHGKQKKQHSSDGKYVAGSTMDAPPPYQEKAVTSS